MQTENHHSNEENLNESTITNTSADQEISNTKVKNSPINSLAPKVLTNKKDIERIQPYLDALSGAISANEITNIALTGSYGSGKSTIINTFVKLNPENKYLRISLASFANNFERQYNAENEEHTKSTNEQTENLEKLLEVSILQQIFYHVKPSVIPNSRFKRIINFSKLKYFLISGCLILWLVSAIILFKFNYITNLNPLSWDINLPFDLSAILSFLIFFAGIGMFAKTIIQFFGNSKINKVNLKGELELGDRLDRSVFNEYLEEILYFFERTKFNVVLLEDLDRFENQAIFTKLRELNTLLNNSVSIMGLRRNAKIKFLYAISDDTFRDRNDRVKFFDYIIPVISFINPSNAGEQLSRLIEEAGIDNKEFKELSEDLITFIDDIDMRLLTNIFHEFQVYSKLLKMVLQQEKLFALIIYKNLFPTDFALLHNRRGVLYDFISNKKMYLKPILENIDQKIANNILEIEKLKDLINTDIEKTKMFYINALYTKIPNITGVQLLNRKVTFAELMQEENFSIFSKSHSIKFYYYELRTDYGSYSHGNEKVNDNGVPFSDLENIVNSNYSYEELKQHIIDVNNNKDQDIKIENEMLIRQKREMESWSLSEIFHHTEIDPYISHFSDNGLMRTLLLNGYIDENYLDYISLFHGINMTVEDFSFEKKVKSGVLSPFDYALTHTAMIVKKLPEKYFNRDAILNNDLMVFLIQNGNDDCVSKRNRIFEFLSTERTHTIEFIDHFIEKCSEQAGGFIRLLIRFQPLFWNYLEKKSSYSEEKLLSYIYLLVLHADLEDLENDNSSLKTYISQCSGFFNLFKLVREQERVKMVIEKLGIIFEFLDAPSAETKILFDFVYRHDFYRINVQNIQVILSEFAPDVSDKEFLSSNYTCIMKSVCTSLIRYVSSSINSYVKNVFLKLDANKMESEDRVLDLLNNKELEYSLKNLIIQGGYIQVTDLSKVEYTDLYPLILKTYCMVPLWNNIMVYFFKQDKDENGSIEKPEMDEFLCSYLNNSRIYSALSGQKFDPEDFNKDYYLEFASLLAKSDCLSLEAYRNVMSSSVYVFESEHFGMLEEKKIEWLIDNHRLILNNTNVEQLQNSFPELTIKLFEKEEESLLKFLEDYEIDESEIATLLGSKVLAKNVKIGIYNNLDEDTIVENRSIAKAACSLLTKMPITKLSFNVIESIFMHSNSIEDRILILNQHFSEYSEDEIKSLVELLKGNYIELFKTRHKPSFSHTEFHLELFDHLKRTGLISSYVVNKTDDSLITVVANYRDR